MSTQKCAHIKANAAVLIVRHRVPLRHHRPVAFQKDFLLVVPSFFLSESGSGSKSSLHVMRSLSGGNTKRVERGGKKGGHTGRPGERRCVSQKNKVVKGRESSRTRGKEGTITDPWPSQQWPALQWAVPGNQILFLVLSQGFVRPSFNRLRQF